VLLILAWAFDKKIFENESVFPAVERSTATSAGGGASTFTSAYFAAQ